MQFSLIISKNKRSFSLLREGAKVENRRERFSFEFRWRNWIERVLNCLDLEWGGRERERERERFGGKRLLVLFALHGVQRPFVQQRDGR